VLQQNRIIITSPGKHSIPAPMGVLTTTMVFGVFSLLLWLTVVAAIPWLRDVRCPTHHWLVSQWHGFGSPANPDLWQRDGVAGAARAAAERMAKKVEISPYESGRRDLDDRRISCDLDGFGRHSRFGTLSGSGVPAVSSVPGSKPWLARLGIRCLDSAIYYQYPRRGLCWRGYVLPRQEAAMGPLAWLGNGIPWCLFHWSFGWPILVMLLPITLLLPWIVQRRRNTWVGIVIHAVFNSTGFILATSSVRPH
jgi:hypothetical protein